MWTLLVYTLVVSPVSEQVRNAAGAASANTTVLRFTSKQNCEMAQAAIAATGSVGDSPSSSQFRIIASKCFQQ
jgi:hypothetical protein